MTRPPPPLSPLDVIHSAPPPTPAPPSPTSPATPTTTPQSPSKPSKKLSIFSPLPTLPHPPTLSLRRLLPFSPRHSPTHHPHDSDDDSEDDDDDDDDDDDADDDSALAQSPPNSPTSTTSRNRPSRCQRRRPRNPRTRFWPRSRPSFLTACSCWVPRATLDGHEEVGTAAAASFVDEVEFSEHLKTMAPTYEPPSPLLPAVGESEEGRICLVLDLDETLVHSSFTPLEGADFEVALEMQGERHTVFVKKRPGVDRFLEKVSEWYEVVVFTASLALYANPVMDLLDPKGRVGLRLYREHCVMIGGCYVKDIAKLGRDLKRIVIVDNSPLSYVLQPENAIPIPAFFTDENDRELDRTLELLEKARALKDVRKAFSQAMLR